MKRLRRLGLILTALAATAALPSLSRAQSATDSTRRKSGLAGVIRDSLGHPIKEARVLVEGLKESAVSDDSGRFDLRGLPPGPNGFMVTKLGYAPVSFEASLLADSLVVLAIRMHAVQTLSTVNINAVRTNRYLDRVGYTDRRQKGLGVYLSPEHLDSLAQSVMTPTQLLREVSGLSVQCPLRCRVETTRGCRPTLIIDGDSHGTQNLDDLGLGPDAIAAIEVYTSVSKIPMELSGQAAGACAMLVVWTKSRIS